MNSQTVKTLTFAVMLCVLVLLCHRNARNLRYTKHVETRGTAAVQEDDYTGDEIENEFHDNFGHKPAMKQLSEEKAAHDDRRLIRLIRDFYIDLPSELPYNLTNGNKQDYSTDQTTFVENALNYMEHGFFVECRAFTGEDRSNSLFLESTRKWTGLLIEADPELYAQLRYKNRKSFTVNACLSPEPHPVMMNLNLNGQHGMMENEGPTQCFPLYSLLLALNQTKVDFLSLAVDGAEIDVLKTIPFDEVDIRMMAVQVGDDKDGDSSMKRFLHSNGYDTSFHGKAMIATMRQLAF